MDKWHISKIRRSNPTPQQLQKNIITTCEINHNPGVHITNYILSHEHNHYIQFYRKNDQHRLHDEYADHILVIIIIIKLLSFA